MKTTRVLLSVAIIAVAGAAMAGQVSLTQTAQAYYAKLDSLTQKKDVDGLTKLLNANMTDDYVFIGKPNKAGQRARRTRGMTEQGMATVMPLIDKFSKSSSHIDRVVVGKNSAVVTVSSNLAWLTKPGTDGKLHLLANKSTVEDTWVIVGKSWKIKSSKNVLGQMTIDGKAPIERQRSPKGG